MYYVYILKDPRSGLPFYVGKGQGERADSHTKRIQDGKRTENPYKDSVIKQILAENLIPEIEYVYYTDDEIAAYDFEADLIIKYGRKRFDYDGILTNLCIDNRPPSQKGKSYIERYGDNAINVINKYRESYNNSRPYHKLRKLSIDQKQKLSERTTGTNNPFYGKKHSTESKKRISNANKGKCIGVDNPNARMYLFVDSNYRIYRVIGEFAKFCEKMNLSYQAMGRGIPKKWIIKSGPSKGWQVLNLTLNYDKDRLINLFEAKGVLIKDGNKLKYNDSEGNEHKYFRSGITNDLLDLIMLEWDENKLPDIPIEFIADDGTTV